MKNNQSLLAAHARKAPADLASAVALSCTAGHFDELRGSVQPGLPPADRASVADGASTASADLPLAKPWTTFFNFLGSDGLGDLNRRSSNLRRQIRDNGVTYNVYADANGPQRPWSLDLFPLLLSPQDWAQIETGIGQRARLLNHIMADVYGPQTILREGLLPAALVQGHPGYLRAMQGMQPAGGIFLHIAAFDIARGPDERWWVVSQRTQAPSGLGYLLENRLSISLLFPEAFQPMNVHPLAASYKALVDGMKALCPGGADSRIVLLTPGPYNETYFEHAYLARYLGLSLVEGSDLLVRGEKLYLKTLQGLEPVHGLLKRLDDEFLDPLELRSDSTLGVPGLLQAIRAGNVLLANAPGSAFLESSALLGFLPALSRNFLGETLSMPSLATWWCGEQAVMQDMLAQLKNCVIKPTYPGTAMESVMGRTLPRAALDEWAGRMLRQGEDYTVQAYLPLSQSPTWQGEKIAPRSTMLRVFALSDGAGSWQVLPGGLARLAGKNEDIASMQHGGSSADVWVLAGSAAEKPASAPALTSASAPLMAATQSRHASGHNSLPQKQPVTSRAAENLFWLGRYTERAENSLRLAQLTLQSLGGEDRASPALLAWLTEMAVGNALVLDTVPAATQARRIFERSLIAGLADAGQTASVGFNLRALKRSASAVRERLSQQQWHVILQMETDFFKRCEAFANTTHHGSPATDYSSLEALRTLESASGFLAAITGAQKDRMMRDDGWRLLSTGRQIERLATLSDALARGFQTRAVFDEGGFDAMLALFDSTITFHGRYQQRRDIAALLDLLVLDRDNPRSLAGVRETLQARLARLAGSATADSPAVADLTATLPDPANWALAEQFEQPPEAIENQFHDGLIDELEQCRSSAFDLSDNISRRYFSHAGLIDHSLGS